MNKESLENWLLFSSPATVACRKTLAERRGIHLLRPLEITFVDGSRPQLASVVNDDLAAVNAIGIAAVHTLVNSLRPNAQH